MKEDQQTGLVIPADIQKRKPGRPTRTNQKAMTGEVANHLTFFDAEGSFCHGKKLIEQMIEALDSLSSSSDEAGATASEYTADLCLTLARQLLDQIPDETLEPLSNGHSLLLLGYLYGMLAMPSRRRLAEAMISEQKVIEANIKRRAGTNSSVETRRKEAEDRMKLAKNHYYRLVKLGMSERDISSRVAQIMGVSAGTVRAWRRKNWTTQTEKRR